MMRRAMVIAFAVAAMTALSVQSAFAAIINMH